MSKIYTIIDTFDDGDAWIANYANKEDALKCFRAFFDGHKLIESDDDIVVDYKTGDEFHIDDLFNDLLDNGYGFHYGADGRMSGILFVRGEIVQNDFLIDVMPFC